MLRANVYALRSAVLQGWVSRRLIAVDAIVASPRRPSRPGTGGRGGAAGGRFGLAVVQRACLVGALALATLVVLLSWSASAWAGSGRDSLVSSGRLLASDAPQILFLSAALSGPVAVAGAPNAKVGSNQAQGAAYVYVERPGGWSTQTESAKLIGSDGQAGDRLGGSVAISGDTVFVAGGTGLYVFTKPSGGWSGTIHERAKLTLTGPAAAADSFFAISGDTVVADSFGNCGCSPAGYVFTKPAGGWGGTVHQSATLTIPNASSACFTGRYSVAIDGSTIAATCSHNAYVFTQPTGGWSGTIQPRATLLPPSRNATFAESVAVLGSTIAVASGYEQTPIDPVVFNEPRSGWSGTIQPTARLKLATDGADEFDEYVVGSEDTIATLVIRRDPICAVDPCTETLYGFSRPFGGWSGTITGPSTDALPFVFATDHGTIATGGPGGVDLLTIKPGPPSATKVSLFGLPIGRPKLRFTLGAGQSAAPIHTLQLTLPRGLRFIHHGTRHPRGVRISVATQQVKLRPGTLTATLRRPAESLTITLARPAINQLKPLAGEVRRISRYNRTHRRKHTLTIRMGCAVTDATGHRTNLTLTAKIS